eukprot:4295179-Amphidinium_carterae.1
MQHATVGKLNARRATVALSCSSLPFLSWFLHLFRLSLMQMGWKAREMKKWNGRTMKEVPKHTMESTTLSSFSNIWGTDDL